MELIRRLYDPVYLAGSNSDAKDIPSARIVYGSAYKMAWPAVMESFLVAIVSIVDTAMVSRLGAGAIAAVSITAQPRMMILAFFLAINIAVTAIVARRKGAGDQAAAKKTLRQAIVITIIMTVILVSLALVFCRDILIFAGAQATGKDAYIDDAVSYFSVIVWSLPLNILSLVLTAAQRGAGNTKISMATNMTSNIVNVVFNYLLIYGNFGFPRLGVRGAAIATAIGIACGLIIALYSVFKNDCYVRLSIKDSWLPDKQTLRIIVDIGGAAMVEQVFMRIGFMTYVKLVAGLGVIDYATHQISMQMLSLSFNFGDGIAIASTALVGQSLGALKPKLALVYGKACQRMALVCAAVVMICFTLFNIPIVKIFTEDPNIIIKSVPIFYMAAVSVPFQVTQVVYNGSLRGSGDTKFVAITSFISITIFRPLISYLMIYPIGLGLIGAWIGLLVDQLVRFTFSWLRFSSGKWMKIKI